ALHPERRVAVRPRRRLVGPLRDPDLRAGDRDGEGRLQVGEGIRPAMTGPGTGRGGVHVEPVVHEGPAIQLNVRVAVAALLRDPQDRREIARLVGIEAYGDRARPAREEASPAAILRNQLEAAGIRTGQLDGP